MLTLALAAGMIVFRNHLVGRALRWAVAILLPLAVLWFCLLPPNGPRIVFAWGWDGRPHLFEPLSQNKWHGFVAAWFKSSFKGQPVSKQWDDYVNRNWDGKNIYVRGWCSPLCGEPYAPRGSFVLTVLGGKFAYAKRVSGGKYDHMCRPIYVTGTQVLGYALPSALGISFLLFLVPSSIMRLVQRLSIPAGHCPECAYNLQGNESGICPECGLELDDLAESEDK